MTTRRVDHTPLTFFLEPLVLQAHHRACKHRMQMSLQDAPIKGPQEFLIGSYIGNHGVQLARKLLIREVCDRT